MAHGYQVPFDMLLPFHVLSWLIVVQDKLIDPTSIVNLFKVHICCWALPVVSHAVKLLAP